MLLLTINIFILVWICYDVASSSIPGVINGSSLNRCASKPNGWQLLYWEKDGECYRIFQKGYPCPDSMELTPGKNGTGECRCPPGTALNSRDAVCYKLHQQGPCNDNEYFGPVLKNNKSPQGHRWGACFHIEECEPGHVYWPKDGKCYRLLSKGPCPEGLLLSANGKFGECKCDKSSMPSHFWEPGLSCHQHYQQGPCDLGQIFLPNATCGCDNTFKEYNPRDNKCYAIGLQGPCKTGHVYKVVNAENEESSHGECVCDDGLLFWNETGNCHQPFTRGPCSQGQMLNVHYSQNETQISCVPLPCSLGQLYFPGGKGCHKVGSEGPCPNGQIVLYKTLRNAADYLSYLGVCGCSDTKNEESSFYPLLESDSGSCNNQRHLETDPSAKTNESPIADAFCGPAGGFVLWKDKSCWQLYTQGPCNEGEWLVPDRSKGQRKGRGWRIGKCECRPGYTIKSTGNSTVCLFNTDLLAKFLRNRF